MPRDLKPICDNPAGLDFDTMPDDGRKFAVLHTAVGSSAYKEGSILTAKHLGPGAQIPRLVASGAIRELPETEAKAAEVAPIVVLDGLPPVAEPVKDGK